MMRFFSMGGYCRSMTMMDMGSLFHTGFGVVFLIRLCGRTSFVSSLFHAAMPSCFRGLDVSGIGMMVVVMVLCCLARVCGRRSRQRPTGQNGKTRHTGQQSITQPPTTGQPSRKRKGTDNCHACIPANRAALEQGGFPRSRSKTCKMRHRLKRTI
jgi:hypothetical protein